MHAETQYVLDSAMELGELTPLEYEIAFSTPDATARLDAALARGEFHPDLVAREMRAVLDQAPLGLKFALALKAMPTLPRAFEAFVERANMVVRNKALKDVGQAPSLLPLVWEDGPAEEEEPVFSSLAEVLPHKVQQVVCARFSRAMFRWSKDLDVIARAMVWFNEGGPAVSDARKAHALSQLRAPEESFAEMVRLARPRPFFNDKRRRSARSAIKKVLKLFERTNRLDTVQALVGGHEVVIAHPSSPFKFVLTAFRSDWLERASVNPSMSSPFNIRLFTKTDVHLANLCVYFKDTPVLDQLLALMLYIESGQESQVLKTANWFGVDDIDRIAAELDTVGTPELKERVTWNRRAIANGLGGEPFPEATTWAPYYGPVSQWLRQMLVPARFAALVQPPAPPMALAA